MSNTQRPIFGFLLFALSACNGASPGSDSSSGATSGGSGGAATGGTGGIDTGGSGGTADGSAGEGGMDASNDLSCSRDASDEAATCDKALTTDVFDPGEVYMIAPVTSGACSATGVTHVVCSSSALLGFGCYADLSELGGIIRPTDGRVIYKNGETRLFHEFRMDLCPLPLGTVNPPFFPFTNDPIVPNDCPAGANVTKYLVAPSGMVMFYCSDTRTWRDNGGQHVYVEPTGDTLRYLGYDNLAINSQPMRVLDLATGTGPVVSGPPGPILTLRAVPPDKFWAVITVSATQTQELWEIARSGATQRLGQYAKATDGSVLSQSSLDKTGALFSLSFLTGTAKGIVRRDLQGSFDLVYDASKNRILSVGGRLITGP